MNFDGTYIGCAHVLLDVTLILTKSQNNKANKSSAAFLLASFAGIRTHEDDKGR